jgi:hypothetical protein
MSNPKHHQQLTSGERAATARLVREHGAEKAAKLLGLQSAQTVRKAAIGEPVHTLTVATVRSRLSQGL